MATHTWPELWYDLPMVVIDVETTGFEPDEDRIIEVGMIHMFQGEVTDSWGQLIDPRRDVPPEVVKLTGIQPEDLVGKPTFDQVAAEVASRLEGRGVVAYNLAFDRMFVSAELERHGFAWPDKNPIFDPLVFAKHFHREHRRHNLGEVSKRLGIDLLEAHRAVDDATVAGHILFAFRDELPPRLEDLQILQRQWVIQQDAEQKFRFKRSIGQSLLDDAAGSATTIGLGPAYVYGNESDPLRALYRTVPNAPRD